MIVFEVDGPKRFKAFLDKEDTLNAVCLPLDTGRALIGTRDGVATLPTGLREAVARCSLEYFIAAENSDANQLLADHIGMAADLLPRSELEGIVAELMQE